MAKYLKKFENHNAYDAAKSGLILPNVSLCVQENHVHYNPSSPAPPTPTYEYVDLGLPSGTLWAKWNVGATSETEYGNYYQYGKGADTIQTTSGGSCEYSGGDGNLPMSEDTAAQVWGGNWHMPTIEQIDELTINTTYEWTTINGVNGGKFTAQNGNYIFIPAAGAYTCLGELLDVGKVGYALSSFNDWDYYYYLTFPYNEEATRLGSPTYSVNGITVRPVMDA